MGISDVVEMMCRNHDARVQALVAEVQMATVERDALRAEVKSLTSLIQQTPSISMMQDNQQLLSRIAELEHHMGEIPHLQAALDEALVLVDDTFGTVECTRIRAKARGEKT